MQYIKLPKNKYALVDDSDFKKVNSLKWYWYEDYPITNLYDEVNKKWRTINMHKFILGLLWSKQQVDHKNGNKLDNQRNNLRLATHAQNNINQPKMKNKTSIYKGVYKPKDRNLFRAGISYKKKRIHLGYYKKQEEAAKVYDIMALKLYKDFAVLNFPRVST